MLHCQFKIKYPSCPFLWNSDTIYEYLEEESEIEYLLNIIDNLFKDDESIDFISNLSDDYLKIFDNKQYTYIKQKIQKQKKDFYLNLNTVAYKDLYGTYINKEFNSSLSWLVIPIIGNIKIDSLNYTINKTNIVDNINYKLDQKILYRQSMRKYNQKLNINNEKIVKTDQYKNNSIINSREIHKNKFDYTIDSVGIKFINNIYKFYPQNSGKISIINHYNIDSYFVSIVKHQKNLHITLHHIEWI